MSRLFRVLGLLAALGALGALGACAQAGGAGAVPLEGRDWVLKQIEGQAVSSGRPPSLRLDSAAGKVSGFSGCNRYTGSATVSGAKLKFGPLAGTRMACVEGMELEQRYLTLLAQTDRYRIEGDMLLLLSGDRTLLGYQMQPAQ
ncbi:META domain-containing protein [Niveibacterium sp. 24ML]|uniref:META domain-containing protein n=1 Tax=Niveibacterium sp. 24ML TaxID=2985512 RepID=UPI00226D5E9E|nr:META domain-containing protein [Niveibacterium sp. 24ML]MCX9157308.1 META domain-containing protein [Niveibacterium sp. 24ML]